MTLFQERLGIDAESLALQGRRWRDAAADARDKFIATTSAPFRGVDIDGDGVPDKMRVAVAAGEAGAALKHAAGGVGEAFGTLFNRKKDGSASAE